MDPLSYLEAWRDEAIAIGEVEPDAMTLATASTSGQPSARIVLFRGVRDGRVCFFTNYESRKGGELTANPRAALLMFWPKLQRQIRLEGGVTRLSAAESDAYFAARPRGHQLQALASPQSREIGSLEEIRARHDALVAQYGDREIPRPEYWGGFGLDPERVELWKQGADRLHERQLFVRGEGGWRSSRLAP